MEERKAERRFGTAWKILNAGERPASTGQAAENRSGVLSRGATGLCFGKADLGEQTGRKRTGRQERTSEDRSSSKGRAEQLPGRGQPGGTSEGLTFDRAECDPIWPQYFISYQNNEK